MQKGFSYLELIVVCAVLVVLATAVIPLGRWDAKRRKEARLRVTLETIRSALDEYNKYVREGLIPITELELDQCALASNTETCWPLSLDELVDGVEIGPKIQSFGDAVQTVQFLGRIPKDPITGVAEWGMRSYQDDWDSRSWGGENVYDVYSLSDLVALDGSYYSEW